MAAIVAGPGGSAQAAGLSHGGGVAVASLPRSYMSPAGNPQQHQQASSFICGYGPGSSGPGPEGQFSNLPIERWSSVAGGDLHTRLSANPIGDLSDKLQRNVIEAWSMTAGNALWSAATSLTEEASQFCFAQGVGYQADKLAQTIGDALSSSGVIAGLVVLCLVVFLWRAARQSPRPWHQLGSSLCVVGLFFVLLHGASGTTGTVGSNPSSNPGAVSFGVMSPGWLVSRVDSAMSAVASVPSAVLSSTADNLAGFTGNNNNALSCGHYVQNLLGQYEQSYGPSPADQAPASIPMALDAMWEQSALRSFIDVQFGSRNDYGPQIYCYLLEDDINVPASQKLWVLENPATYSISDHGASLPAELAGPANAIGGNSLALFSDSSDNKAIDRSMIGWAACQTDANGGWLIPYDFQQVGDPDDGDSKVTSQVCDQWWAVKAGPNSLFDSGSSPLEWVDSANDIQSAAQPVPAGPPGSGLDGASEPAGAPQFQDFLLNFHGDANSAATATSVMFFVTSMVVFVVFAILALAIIIAKVTLLIMMALAPLVLAIALFPASGMASRATGFLKHGFGLILFTVGAQIILALVALISGFIVGVGTTTFGAGSMLSVLFTGFAPIAALVVMHHIFKHVIQAPSPFKLTSALAWGAAAGGLGTGLGAGLERRLSYHGRQAGRVAWARTGGRIGGKFGPGRGQRVGGMTAPAAKTGFGSNGSGPGGAIAAPAAGGRNGQRNREANGLVPLPEQMNPQRSNVALADSLRSARQQRSAAPERGGGWSRAGAARLQNATVDRAKLAWERFAQSPVRNSFKTAGVAATVAALPVAFAPAMGVAAAAYGVHKAKQFHREGPALRAQRAQRAQDAYRTQMARSTIAAQNLSSMTAGAGVDDKAIRELCRSEGLGDRARWQQAMVERYGPERAQEKVRTFVEKWIEDNPAETEARPAPGGPRVESAPR
jgi:hypothetical protein